jgi:hypothetical protein
MGLLGQQPAGVVKGVSIPTATHWWYPSSSGNANDLIGSLNGTMKGGLTTSANGWEMGTADAKYVELAGPLDNGTSYTINVWINPDVTAMDANMFGGWILSDRSNLPDDVQISYSKNRAALVVVGFNTSNTLSVVEAPATNGAWQMLTMTAGGGFVSFFKNAVFVDKTAYTGTLNDTSTRNAIIGDGSWTVLGKGETKYHGNIDNLAHWKNQILTPSQILALYNLGR